MARWSLVLTLSLVACGGASTAPNTSQDQSPPEPTDGAAADQAGTTETEGDGYESLTPEQSRVIAQQKSDFLTKCTEKQSGNEAYCQCSWQQLKQIVSAEDMLDDRVTDQQLKAFQKAIVVKCSNELPEEMVKAQFMKGCGTKANGAFCECAYTELRKRVEIVDITTQGGDDPVGFEKKRNEATTACVDKLPKAEVRAGFMKGCVKEPRFQTFCDCAWGYLSGRLTIGQLVMGGPAVDAQKQGLMKNCPAPGR